MQNRREFLTFFSLLAVACVSEHALAKGGKGYKMLKKKKEKTTCSGKLKQVVKKKCSKPEAGQTPAQCKTDAEVRYRKCLQSGVWLGENKTIQLEKR